MSRFGSPPSEDRDLVGHLEPHGCRLLCEGSNHTLYVNPEQRKVTTIPRHREIKQYLARKICRDLGVPKA